jgi:hypothetical protein
MALNLKPQASINIAWAMLSAFSATACQLEFVI